MLEGEREGGGRARQPGRNSGRGSVGEAVKKRVEERREGRGEYEKLHNIAQRSIVNKKGDVGKFRSPQHPPSSSPLSEMSSGWNFRKRSVCG